jgi:hypothetical protein
MVGRLMVHSFSFLNLAQMISLHLRHIANGPMCTVAGNFWHTWHCGVGSVMPSVPGFLSIRQCG